MSQAGDTVPVSAVDFGKGGAAAGIRTVTVKDLRGGPAGWSLTGRLTDFTGPGGEMDGAARLDAGLHHPRGSPSTCAAGSPARSARAGATLACTPDGALIGGEFTVDAEVSLDVPAYTAPGAYTGVLTLTLTWASRAGDTARAGRTGRPGPLPRHAPRPWGLPIYAQSSYVILAALLLAVLLARRTRIRCPRRRQRQLVRLSRLLRDPRERPYFYLSAGAGGPHRSGHRHQPDRHPRCPSGCTPPTPTTPHGTAASPQAPSDEPQRGVGAWANRGREHVTVPGSSVTVPLHHGRARTGQNPGTTPAPWSPSRTGPRPRAVRARPPGSACSGPSPPACTCGSPGPPPPCWPWSGFTVEGPESIGAGHRGDGRGNTNTLHNLGNVTLNPKVTLRAEGLFGRSSSTAI